MPNITGSLKEALALTDAEGGRARGRITIKPYGTDVRVSNGNAVLGALTMDVESMPSPLTLDAGSYTIMVVSTGYQVGTSRNEFSPKTVNFELTTDTSWGALFAGEAQSPPLTPSLVVQAQEAATTAETAATTATAAATAAEAVGTTNDTIIAGRIADPTSATATTLSATYALKGEVGGGLPAWEPNVAYNIGDIVVSPEGAIVERATAGVTTDATYSPIGWKTATGLAQAIAGSEAPRFGPLTMPAGFPTLPTTFYRDNDGVIRHNFNFGAYYPATATKVYVATTGNDTTGDGTSGLPYRTLQKAMTVVAAGAATNYEVIITDVAMFDRDQAGFTGTLTGKTVAVRSQVAGRTLLTTNSTYSWAADGAGTYKATRSGVTGVLDAGNRDHHGLPPALKLVASIAACQAEAGTYYTDGATVWVHRLDGALPTHDSTVVTIGTSAFSPTLAGGARLYVEGIIFCGWSNGDGLRVTGGATSTTETVVARDCGFVGTSGNGYMTNQVAKTYMFDCQSAYQQRDGFNYTFFGMTWAHARANTLVVEYGCTAYKVGLVDPGAGSNNTSTCHDGGNVLRINHVGYENTGACIIDVGGCFSVFYDCHARSPILPTGGSGQTAAFLLSANSSAQAGKAYLYDCSAADCDIALNIGTNTTAYVARFRTIETIIGGGTIVYV